MMTFIQVKIYQLLEYQTDMRRCRFDTLGKQTSAPLAGGPPPYTGGVPPARGVSADAASPGPPPARGVGLFPAHNSEGLPLIHFSQESGRIWCLRKDVKTIIV